MGVIGSQALMPSSKFTNPSNLATILADQTFTITMSINNLVTGNFVNAQANYFGAPQNTDAQGVIIGKLTIFFCLVFKAKLFCFTCHSFRSLSRSHRSY